MVAATLGIEIQFGCNRSLCHWNLLNVQCRKEVQQMSFSQRQQWQWMQFSQILGNDGERRDPAPMAWTLMDIID